MHFSGTPERASALTHEALTISRRLGDPSVLADALEARIWTSFHPDGVHERLATADELLALSEELGREDLEARARRWRITALLELAQFDAARSEIARHKALTERLGGYEEVYAFGYARMEDVMAARWEEATQPDTRHHGRDSEQFATAVAMTVAFENGHARHLAPIIVERIQQEPHISSWRTALLVSYAEAGEHDKARHLLDEMAESDFAAIPRDVNWMIAMALIVLAADRLGETGYESALYELLSPYADRVVVVGHGGVTWGPVSYYLGVLAKNLGRREEALRHLEAARVFCERVGAVTWSARAVVAVHAVDSER